MKKTISYLFLLTINGGLLVGCSSKKTEDPEVPSQPSTVEGTTESIMEKIQEPLKIELMIMGESVDLSDKDSLKYNLGLDKSDGIKEAYVSNGMMSQAYAVVLVRTEEGADAKKIANDMVAGVDPMKWICAGADDIQAAVSGDLILFVMIDSKLDTAGSSEYFDAFEALTGVSVDATYKR